MTGIGSLKNLRVLDASRVLGGPYAGQILADHGADVIKLEPPAGDETRGWGPPFLGDAASYFLGVNRNKRGMAVDLSQEMGQELFLAMLENTDVLIENFKTGTLGSGAGRPFAPLSPTDPLPRLGFRRRRTDGRSSGL